MKGRAQMSPKHNCV